jgi:Calcineurin-like phosphoesterase
MAKKPRPISQLKAKKKVTRAAKGAAKASKKRAVKTAVKKPAKGVSKTTPATTVRRFAHPFFTTTPIAARKNVPGVGKRLATHIAKKLEKIPDPIRNPPVLTLADIIGQHDAKAMAAKKSISFHAVGDTGHIGGGTEDMQEYVADAMASDFDIAHPNSSPAFFFHLGDVDYFDNTDKGYQEQFYVPYKRYPGKIIAIPGNHDGEIYKYDGSSVGQKNTLDAFIRNFVQPQASVPPAAGTIYRQMVSQPGVYWSLEAPLLDIIGLYSNVAEGPGYIADPTIGNKQKDWLGQTLTKIKAARTGKTRNALIIGVHHPFFSCGAHSGSPQMLTDLDEVCHKCGITPDAVLSAHSHDYQRYTRYVSLGNRNLEIPFIVAGGGGRGLSSHLSAATGIRVGDRSYEKSLKDYGYLKVTVTASEIEIQFIQVSVNAGVMSKTVFDSVIVDLNTNKLR